MDINKMKLGLIYIFSENDKLSKQAKLQLINFIEQADEYQLKVLAMDGEIVAESKLDEQARQIISDRFKTFSELAPIGWAAIVAMAAVIGAKRRKVMLKKYNAGCLGKKGKVLKVCMQQGTVKAYKDEISMYKSQMGKCSQTKKPEKCKKALGKHIVKAQTKMAKAAKKLVY
jgi:hypothetical protein